MSCEINISVFVKRHENYRAKKQLTELVTEPIVLTIITVLGSTIAAYMTFLGTKMKSDRDRLGAIEARLDKTEKQNIGLWAYCRALIDHIYKGGGPPPPDPPSTILDLFG